MNSLRIITCVSSVVVVAAGTAVYGQDRKCPDGGPSIFGYCPTDRPAPNDLQRQLEQWADYPKDIPLTSNPPDLLEVLSSNKAPQQLYQILSPYDRQTIASYPGLGPSLQAYKDAYYNYRVIEIDFESSVSEIAGTLPRARTTQARNECVQYVLFRATGHTPDTLKKDPQFMMLSSFDEAEQVFQQVQSNKAVASRLQSILAARDKIFSLSVMLSAAIKSKNAM